MVGYSGTPLAKKLGIKAGHEVLLVGAPPGYPELLDPLPDALRFASALSETTDLIHAFVYWKTDLERLLAALRAESRASAIVWISWPKKACRVPTDISEDVVRELALPLGFVDTKVCAVDEVWSGLKLTVRKALRCEDAPHSEPRA